MLPHQRHFRVFSKIKWASQGSIDLLCHPPRAHLRRFLALVFKQICKTPPQLSKITTRPNGTTVHCKGLQCQQMLQQSMCSCQKAHLEGLNVGCVHVSPNLSREQSKTHDTSVKNKTGRRRVAALPRGGVTEGFKEAPCTSVGWIVYWHSVAQWSMAVNDLCRNASNDDDQHTTNQSTSDTQEPNNNK